MLQFATWYVLRLGICLCQRFLSRFSTKMYCRVRLDLVLWILPRQPNKSVAEIYALVQQSANTRENRSISLQKNSIRNKYNFFQYCITFRAFTSLFWASSLARICLLLRIAWYCFALTNIGSSAAGSTGSGTREFVAAFNWGWTWVNNTQIVDAGPLVFFFW